MGSLASALLILAAAAVDTRPPDDGIAWHWNNDTPSCALLQRTRDNRVVELSRFPGHDDIVIRFKVRSPSFFSGVYKDASVTLSTGEIFPATVRVYSAENRQYEVAADVERAGFAGALADSTGLTVSHPKFGKFELPLRALGSATKALRSCDSQKLRSWGVDPDAYWALAARPEPIGSLADLFTSDVYPRIATSRNIERKVIATLQVSADGTVKSCTAPGNYSYPQFVDAVCDVLVKGARFKPARDASGNAVAAPFVQLVTFKMRGF